MTHLFSITSIAIVWLQAFSGTQLPASIRTLHVGWFCALRSLSFDLSRLWPRNLPRALVEDSPGRRQHKAILKHVIWGEFAGPIAAQGKWTKRRLTYQGCQIDRKLRTPFSMPDIAITALGNSFIHRALAQRPLDLCTLFNSYPFPIRWKSLTQGRLHRIGGHGCVMFDLSSCYSDLSFIATLDSPSLDPVRFSSRDFGLWLDNVFLVFASLKT